ncbi:hypothetical protein P22_3537 [Propionispora sp. 2/2-37]|uniref:hypothetical protein n=1 Tax=Propionispora sp. 2/2-37 TaxID=1677858 RepID=UPI0006BB64D2|nr:hypothetical protein [Propionispora sp. 2/2-37]CUH97408.1 hypothetical protein P22_3537 [Propionispora sp. 2/2-37]
MSKSAMKINNELENNNVTGLIKVENIKGRNVILKRFNRFNNNLLFKHIDDIYIVNKDMKDRFIQYLSQTESKIIDALARMEDIEEPEIDGLYLVEDDDWNVIKAIVIETKDIYYKTFDSEQPIKYFWDGGTYRVNQQYLDEFKREIKELEKKYYCKYNLIRSNSDDLGKTLHITMANSKLVLSI